jgi:hypothetical protein
VSISCPAPRPVQKSKLVELGYGRITTGDDPLHVDASLDAIGTARLLSTLFPAVYGAYCIQNNHSVESPPPLNWFFHLVKTRRQLNNVPGQDGATMQQLLSRASMSGGRILTKEIYLGKLSSHSFLPPCLVTQVSDCHLLIFSCIC